MRTHIALLIITLIAMVCSCTRDRALAPIHLSVQCDTATVSYHTCILPIFQRHCYECHSDAITSGGSLGFDIEDFSQLKSYLNYYYHNDSVYGSKFMRAIAHQSGVLVMPPSYSMPGSSIDLVRAWIRHGAPGS